MEFSAPKSSVGQTKSSETDSCSAMTEADDKVFRYFLLFSVIITIGLTFTVRRKNYWWSCCWGRPGFLQPVNFIDEVYRRWAYSACFVILTINVLGLFVGQSHLIKLPTDDAIWMSKYGWVNVFVNLLEALAVSLVYYPLLACINHRHSIAANVLGVIYIVPWIMFYSCYFHFCPLSPQTRYDVKVGYVAGIPIYIAFYIVGFSYALDFVRNIRRRRNLRRKAILETNSSDASNEHLDSFISHHFEYVANLLRPRKPEQINETENAIKLKSKQVIKRVKYDKIMGFRYSTRLVCCTTTAATLIIWTVATSAAYIEVEVQDAIRLCGVLVTALPIPFLIQIYENLNAVMVSMHVANALAGFIVLIFMANTLVNYKRRWHQLLRGDHSWHIYGTTMDSPSKKLLSGLKYAGFQVAYAFWGYVALLGFLWIVFMIVAFGFIIPLKKGEDSWLITLLKDHWPTVLILAVIDVIQWIICRFIFLQDKGSSMALDNRRMYNAASYCFLLMNVLVGFFSCLSRILISVVLGIFFLSRLDRPLVLQGFEIFDFGYASFVSMLLVDLHHNHPVVKAFVELLLQVREQQQPFAGVTGEGVIQSEEKLRRSKLIRNRWWKTVTLANNPSLVLEVLEQRLRDERNNAALTNVGNGLRSIELQQLPENSSFA